ncbi:MAG TPA: CPBP family intramembrane metalloprotease [Oligoflexia bacterium]|nr:CPBP family intramembrane metalloprotease [Oligoflexia bacterium]HMP26622.1 CPBP family intramembrane metalloprotease [Oligoflexia bacterium]
MRNLILVIGGAIFLSALVSPAIFFFLISWIDGFSYPYSRVFDRVVVVFVLLALLVFWKKIRLDFDKRWLKNSRIFWKGFICGALGCVIIYPFLFNEQIVFQSNQFSISARFVFKTVAAALIVSFIEEVFFRGILFSLLRVRFGLVIACVFGSAIYSILHFLQPAYGFRPINQSPLEGLRYLEELFVNLFIGEMFLGFFTLFVAGCFLAIIFAYSNSLWVSIGLHSAWIISLKTSKFFIYLDPEVRLLGGIPDRYILLVQPPILMAIVFGGCLTLAYLFFCGKTIVDQN